MGVIPEKGAMSADLSVVLEASDGVGRWVKIDVNYENGECIVNIRFRAPTPLGLREILPPVR